jgi:hypothetical protein
MATAKLADKIKKGHKILQGTRIYPIYIYIYMCVCVCVYIYYLPTRIQ